MSRDPHRATPPTGSTAQHGLRAADPGARALGEGAAQAAPTAPHATPRTTPRAKNEPPSGPERFWARWPVRVALGAGLLVSAAAHCSVLPFGIPRGFEVQEVEGEVAIPIDLLVQGAMTAADRADQSAKASETPGEPRGLASPAEGPGRDAAVATGEAEAAPRASDAGDSADAEQDSSVSEASKDDAEAGADAASEARSASERPDGALAPDSEAGTTSGGPRDPQAIVGAAGALQADVVLVMLVLNGEVMRAHPVGARLGFLLRALPQWNDFMSGTEIDPVRDVDWLVISGPSLLSTSRDVVLIHYSASDAVVDKAIDVLSRRSDHGGPIDAGARGVRAVLAHADRADRVILRTQAHVVAVVPPAFAQKVARQLVASPAPAHIRPGEALYLRLVDPHHPMPEIPESLKELRLRIVPRDDGGADVYAEADTADAEAARTAADELRRVVRRHNDGITSLVTGGILDHVDIRADHDHVELHLTATRAQIERLAELGGDFLGVAPDGTATPAPGIPAGPNGGRAPFSPR